MSLFVKSNTIFFMLNFFHPEILEPKKADRYFFSVVMHFVLLGLRKMFR